MVKIIFLNILFLLLSACSSKQDSLSNVDKHTIKSTELRLLMRDLNMVVDDRHKSELERDSMRRRYALNLVNKIEEFSYQVKSLSKKKLGKHIDNDDMHIFAKYIKELQDKGEEIAHIAQNYELEKLDSKIRDLEYTCKACHSEFRNYP